MIYSDAVATIASTPVMWLDRLTSGMPSRIIAKLEMRNPGGSVKDRLGVALIDDAERNHNLETGQTLIEATGGNTGIGLAVVAAVRGYRLMLTMPESMSTERIALLRQLGADIELTPGILMTDAVRRAQELAREISNSVLLEQFSNAANPEVHRRTTALEILDAVKQRIDVFVCAVGTGGTITGVGEVLKRSNPEVRIVAVEPAGAAVLSGRVPGAHKMPGIGVGFIPPVLNRAIIDDVVAVTDEDAFRTARDLARSEGIVAGVSSGSAVHVALQLAKLAGKEGQTVLVILPDTGERYVTTDLFQRTCPQF